MATPAMTPKELMALFAAKATAPPAEASQLLVRHMKCQDSVHLARFVSQAIDRYSGDSHRPLSPPTELLAPMG